MLIGLNVCFRCSQAWWRRVGKLSLETLVERMSLAPARRLVLTIGIATPHLIYAQEIIDPERFLPIMGRATLRRMERARRPL